MTVENQLRERIRELYEETEILRRRLEVKDGDIKTQREYIEEKNLEIRDKDERISELEAALENKRTLDFDDDDDCEACQ